MRSHILHLLAALVLCAILPSVVANKKENNHHHSHSPVHVRDDPPMRGINLGGWMVCACFAEMSDWA